MRWICTGDGDIDSGACGGVIESSACGGTNLVFVMVLREGNDLF